MDDVKAARALGWASLGIAATEVFGQGYVEKELLGIDEHPHLLQALGAREAIAGVTILSQTAVTPTLAAGLWSRVAGDAMDIALLATAAAKTRKPVSLAANTLVVLGITALDVYLALRVQKKLVAQSAARERFASDEGTAGTRRERQNVAASA